MVKIQYKKIEILDTLESLRINVLLDKQAKTRTVNSTAAEALKCNEGKKEPKVTAIIP